MCTMLHVFAQSSSFFEESLHRKSLLSYSQPGLILMLSNGLILANSTSSLFSCCDRLFWVCWAVYRSQYGSRWDLGVLSISVLLTSFLCMQGLNFTFPDSLASLRVFGEGLLDASRRWDQVDLPCTCKSCWLLFLKNRQTQELLSWLAFPSLVCTDATFAVNCYQIAQETPLNDSGHLPVPLVQGQF